MDHHADFHQQRKTPINPILFANNNLISFAMEKANFFNNFFVQQCQPLANNSILQTNQIFSTYNRLRDSNIDCGEILKLINALNPREVHDHDGISIVILKSYDLPITKHL